MQVANVRLVLRKDGSDVPKTDITPAEAVLLHILHGPVNGGKTFGEEFDKIDIIGDALVEVTPAIVVDGKVTKPAVTRPRTDAEELKRLSAKYNQARDKDNKPIINTIWPDKLNPKLPATFKEVKWQEVGSLGIETAPLNYATGAVATSTK